MSDSQTIKSLQAENNALHQRVAQLERELAQSQTMFQQILDNAPASIFVKDTDGHYLVVNKHLSTLLEQDSTHMTGKTVSDLLPPETAQRVHEIEQQVLTSGTPATTEIHIPLKDHERIHLSHRFPLYNEHGDIYAVGGIGTDITQMKQTEHELSIFKTLVHHSPAGIVVMQTNGTITYANPSYCTMHGYEGNMSGTSVTSLVTEDEAATIVQGLEQFAAQHEHHAQQVLFTSRRKDGSTFPTSVNAFVVRDDSGTGQAIAAVVNDITTQLQHEQALRESEERFRAIIEKMPAGVCITNEQHYFEYVNPAYCQIYRYTPEELIGQPFTIVVPPAQRESAATLHDRFMQGETEIPAEWQVLTKDGNPLTILADAAAITGADGLPKKVTFVIDITERKHAEAERIGLQQQVIDAQQTTIRELSTPLIPLTSNVVLMPLIGSLDSQRAQLVLETLLEGIAHYQADMALVDITGISVIDTQVANVLVQAANAVRLLGAKVLLTGIGPTMAQTIIHLGADLSSIVTRSTLQSGIEYALKQ